MHVPSYPAPSAYNYASLHPSFATGGSLPHLAQLQDPLQDQLLAHLLDPLQDPLLDSLLAQLQDPHLAQIQDRALRHDMLTMEPSQQRQPYTTKGSFSYWNLIGRERLFRVPFVESWFLQSIFKGGLS